MPPFDPTKAKRSKKARRTGSSPDGLVGPPQGSFGLLGPQVSPPRTAGLLGPIVPVAGKQPGIQTTANKRQSNKSPSMIDAQTGSSIAPDDADDAFDRTQPGHNVDPTTAQGAVEWYFNPNNSNVDVAFSLVDIGLQPRDFKKRDGTKFKNSEPFGVTVKSLRGKTGTFPYSGWAKETIRQPFGQMTYLLAGAFEVENDGWAFNGAVTAKEDEYNFDEKTWGERTIPAEVATRAFALVPGGKPFKFIFNGSRAVQDGGKWQ
ncbi:MAG: hypothetical protein MI806_16395 [Minwuiales bacterium]|nr:hypothetical protein [Minwuiales bacterium]